jgi:hypothetical protein
MIANLLQPSLDQREKSFGDSGLFSPHPQGDRLLLQLPSAFPWLARQAPGQTPSSTQPALVELARDWVKIVLKTSPTRKTHTSVFDMPPLDLGRVLYSGGARDDLLEEMLDDTRF